jgi:hypothetical protein
MSHALLAWCIFFYKTACSPFPVHPVLPPRLSLSRCFLPTSSLYLSVGPASAQGSTLEINSWFGFRAGNCASGHSVAGVGHHFKLFSVVVLYISPLVLFHVDLPSSGGLPRFVFCSTQALLLDPIVSSSFCHLLFHLIILIIWPYPCCLLTTQLDNDHIQSVITIVNLRAHCACYDLIMVCVLFI